MYEVPNCILSWCAPLFTHDCNADPRLLGEASNTLTLPASQVTNTHIHSKQFHVYENECGTFQISLNILITELSDSLGFPS